MFKKKKQIKKHSMHTLHVSSYVLFLNEVVRCHLTFSRRVEWARNPAFYHRDRLQDKGRAIEDGQMFLQKGNIKEETADLRKALSADMQICFCNSQALQSHRERRFNRQYVSIILFIYFYFLFFCARTALNNIPLKCFRCTENSHLNKQNAIT